MSQVEHIFRAYDVRGVFNVELTVGTAAKIGASFGTYLGGKGRVLVGRDVRTSSPLVESAFNVGLASAGVDVVSTGLVPIPVANFKTMMGDFDAGAYITASHNPPEYNGVRLRRADGSGYTEENQRVWEIFLENNTKYADWNALGSVDSLDAKKTIDEYKSYLLERVSLQKPLKLVLDVGNGAAYCTAPLVLREAGAEVSVINGKPDGTFPGRPSEPSDATLNELKETVVKEKADFGAGYDGDSDRVIFVDDKGRTVQTEKMGIVLARDIMRRRKGGIVVANVSCSMMVEEEIGKLGGVVERVRVGDVFVCEAIREHDAVFALETSAHLFMPEFYIFDDPILATLLLAKTLSVRGQRLSDMVDGIPSYPYMERNFWCDDAIKFKVMGEVKKALAAGGYELDLTDGVKVNFEDGWLLLRPSNTNPLIRMAAEAREGKRLEELVLFAEKEIARAVERVK
ncbi:MAG: phosphoglucomutase [Candidatus Hydrothermarchaeaceae archaeon]